MDVRMIEYVQEQTGEIFNILHGDNQTTCQTYLIPRLEFVFIESPNISRQSPKENFFTGKIRSFPSPSIFLLPLQIFQSLGALSLVFSTDFQQIAIASAVYGFFYGAW